MPIWGIIFSPLSCLTGNPLFKSNHAFSTWFDTFYSSSSCVIVRVRVVLNRTAIGEWCFDNLTGSHLQSQWIQFVSRWCIKSGPLKVIGQFSHDGIDWKTLSLSWLWRWLPLRLSKRQSPTTVLFRTTLTRTITQCELLILLGSNHLLRYILF